MKPGLKLQGKLMLVTIVAVVLPIATKEYFHIKTVKKEYEQNLFSRVLIEAGEIANIIDDTIDVGVWNGKEELKIVVKNIILDPLETHQAILITPYDVRDSIEFSI